MDPAPGEFALGPHWEYVKLDASIAARLEGKSSLGRLGILTHSTAGFIDPGFEGHITLELSNVSTLAGEAVAGHEDRPDVLLPAELAGRASVRLRHDRFALSGQRGPTPSRSYVNFYKADITD